MKFTERQQNLLEFVKIQHGEQVRKYTGEPYWNHVISVAEIVSTYSSEFSVEIEVALCHDLFEDTECSAEELREFLLKEYAPEETTTIIVAALELTDEYTFIAFPKFNRAKRKLLEAKRLGRVSALAQTVKYADLIDNLFSISENDPKFAVTYLQEKKMLIQKMQDGNFDLYLKCCSCYFEANLKINDEPK